MELNYTAGIDPGSKPGIAIIDNRTGKFEVLKKMYIHEAMDLIRIWKLRGIRVFVEDARKRKWYGDNAAVKRQGAGSVKRDCTIWESFLKDQKVEFHMIHPIKGGTKWNHKRFCAFTGYTGSTNKETRDAGVIAFVKCRQK